jgi:hypothetical protein
VSAAACSQTGCSGLAPAPELSPYGAPAAATSPCRAFMNKPPLIPNSYLISFLLNLTHTSLILLFPSNACRGERCAVWGRRAPSMWLGLFSFGAFPLHLPRRVSPRAICYPQAHQQRIGACIMTYSGREEERAPSIYRSSSRSHSAAVSRVRHSKGYSSMGEKVSLSAKGSSLGERFS